MGNRSLKSGADVKRNEAVSLNLENALLHETPSQIQHKTKSYCRQDRSLGHIMRRKPRCVWGVLSASAVLFY